MKRDKTHKDQNKTSGATGASPFSAKPPEDPLVVALTWIAKNMTTLSDNQAKLNTHQGLLSSNQKLMADYTRELFELYKSLDRRIEDAVSSLIVRLDQIDAKIDRVIESMEATEYETVRRSLEIVRH